MGANLVDGVDISARDAVLTSTATTASAAMPKAGGAFTGAITTNSTIDTVDIATRDGVLTTTTTTANAALPKAGGTMTGNIAHAGNFTLDVGGEINLDADGGKVRFKDAGTDIGFISFSNTDLTFYSSVQDKDIIFQGNDGGSAVTALTLDMSEAGKAAFNSGATFGASVTSTTNTDTSNNGTVDLDFAANQNFVLTLDGNITSLTASNEQVGQSGFIAFIQDGTGGRTVALHGDYETAAAAGLTLTSTASATDLVPYLVVASSRILLGTPQLAFA